MEIAGNDVCELSHKENILIKNLTWEHASRMKNSNKSPRHSYQSICETCKTRKNVFDGNNILLLNEEKLAKSIQQIIHELLENNQISEIKSNKIFCSEEDQNKSVNIALTGDPANEKCQKLPENLRKNLGNHHEEGIESVDCSSNVYNLSRLPLLNRTKDSEIDHLSSEFLTNVQPLDFLDDHKGLKNIVRSGISTCVSTVKKDAIDDEEGPFYLDREIVDVEAYQNGLHVKKWNPTQVLYELCSINYWDTPGFYEMDFVLGEGFLFCVQVKGITFYSTRRCKIKKLAKHYASSEFLQFIGFKFDYDGSPTPDHNVDSTQVDTTDWIRPRVRKDMVWRNSRNSRSNQHWGGGGLARY